MINHLLRVIMELDSNCQPHNHLRATICSVDFSVPSILQPRVWILTQHNIFFGGEFFIPSLAKSKILEVLCDDSVLLCLLYQHSTLWVRRSLVLFTFEYLNNLWKVTYCFLFRKDKKIIGSIRGINSFVHWVNLINYPYTSV